MCCLKGLGDHNYCRNPDDDAMPWCWTQPTLGNWEYCDMSPCSDGGGFDVTVSAGAASSTTTGMSAARTDVDVSARSTD